MISYQFLHLTIIQGYSKLSLLDKGFPKGGGGGGPTFGKNSQIISFFFFESVPNLFQLSKKTLRQIDTSKLYLCVSINKVEAR